MSKGLVCLALLAMTAALEGAQGVQKPRSLIQWRYAGNQPISTRKDVPALREILALPETRELRQVAFEQFALHAARRIIQENRSATNDFARLTNLVGSILPDLLDQETRFEMAGADGRGVGWTLALKLPKDRATLWSQNLSELARLAGMKVTGGRSAGEWSATGPKNEGYRLVFSRKSGWTILRGGDGPSALDEKHFAKFTRSLRNSPGGELLRAEIDLPGLAAVFPGHERLRRAPKIVLSASPRKDGVRSEMVLDYPEAFEIKPEPWNVPADLVREPLIGFTALQGLRPHLAKAERFRALEPERTPNQVFFWSQESTPFSVYLAADVGNPIQIVTNLATKLIPKLNLTNLAGNFQYVTNRNTLMWRGLPVIIPYIEPAPEPYTNFIVAGLFPVANQLGGRAPESLFEQLKKKDLVYYDWEITQARLDQWKPIWQLRHIIPGKLLLQNAAPSEKWINAIASKLANTVTEVTLENPRRLKMVRQSQSGFTALELTLLAHWIDPYDLRPIRPPVRRTGAGPSHAPPPQ